MARARRRPGPAQKVFVLRALPLLGVRNGPSAAAALAAAAALLSATGAAAQARWLDGNFGFVPGSACVTWNAETEVTTYAGYWGTTNGSFPRTGDVSYVHAAGAVVGNPCSGGDVIGFDFFLPAGASLAVSAQNPVRCIATRLSDGSTTTTDPNIHCSQTPSTGNAGGLFFGYAVTPHGWVFEIQVPVEFDKALHGLAGTAAEKLTVVTSSANGPRTVEQFVTVPLRAIVNYPAPSATYLGTDVSGAHYQLTSYIYNYFTAGVATLDVGTVSGTYSNPNLAPANIPDTANGFYVNTNLTLSAAYAGQIYWRTKFVVNATGATFNGPEQSFTANGQNATSYTLTATKNGTGSGAVSSDPQGLNCGATCSKTFTAGTQMTLTASPSPGSQFTGWAGACAAAGACTFSMSANTAVTATFDTLPPVTIGSLDIVPSGVPATASASIAVTGPGGFNTTYTILGGRAVSVSDVLAGQYDAVAANVVVGADTWVPRPARPSAAVLGGGKGTIATTYSLGRALTVTKAGAGAGTVMSNPASLSCGATCTAYFADGESVTLTAAAAAGSNFTGWSGACSGASTCTLTMSAAASATATFGVAPPQTTNTLSVSKAGAGAGTITSAPAGIDCGTSCSHAFDSTLTVTLTAAPAAGSTFTGWSGDCAGAGACSLAMSAAHTAVATFAGAADAGPSGTDAGPTPAPHGGGGCSSVPGGFSVAALVLLGALARRRRGSGPSAASPRDIRNLHIN